MSRVLITGGAGYLGSILTGELLRRGHHVTVVDNLMYGQQSLFNHCSDEAFEFIRGDVRDERLMQELVPKADVIIPLAAIVGMPACDKDPWLAESVNLGAIRLINRIRGAGQLVIYPNTNSGYGTKDGDLHCDEDTSLEPISLYGRTKVQAEQELLAAGNCVVFRLATVFGISPRMRLDLLVNHFVHAAVTDGYLVIFEKDFKRNYVHIRDVADCFAFAIQNAADLVGRPFNLGLDDANLSKAELAELVMRFVPRLTVQYAEIGTDPDQRNYIVSNARLKQAGFAATRSLEQGVRELLMGYRMLPRSIFKNV